MTPSMGMAAPKGTQAPQAGLAAIAQPNTAPKGMTSGNMAQIMATARKMSDAQLAEVLQGKSLDVPQFVAMTEAMGRKQLRTAMGGAQAMAQLQQPSLKDKLLMGDQPQGIQQMMPQQPVMAAEGGLMYAGGGAIDMNETANAGGIADLPAPNMEPMTMAGGGIVAFSGADGDSEVKDEEARNPLAYLNPGDLYSRLKNYIKEKQTNAPPTPLQAQIAAAGAAHPSAVPAPTAEQTANFMGSPVPVAAAPAAPDVSAPGRKAVAAALNAPGGAPSGKSGLGGTDEFSSYMDMVKKNREDYLAKLEGLGAKQREGLAQLRKEGGGEALMNLAQGILSKSTLAQGIAAGLPGVIASSAASRKEQREIEKSAGEMDLNLAKAREAASKGDMESALMFKKLADEANYRNKSLALQSAQLNQLPDAVRTAMAVQKDPSLAQYIPSFGKSSQLSLAEATKQWNDLPKDNRKYYKELQSMGINNEQDYYRFVNGQLLSATIPGEGATRRPY